MADQSHKEVEEQLKKKGIKKDKDVIELYLANRSLETVHDLNRFKYLQRVYLNGNRLRRLSNCFRSNYQITEVYLQNNFLHEVNGALQHLRCLEVLMLNGNQLTKLPDVVHECRNMQKLRDLNLFGNPLFQEYDYRPYVIHFIPSLQVLDRKEILRTERDKAFKKYEPYKVMVKDTVSFGRCVEGPPQQVYFPPSTSMTAADTGNVVTEGDNLTEYSITSNEKDDPINAAVEKRSLQRSIVQYSTFDWSTVPLSEEKRLSEGEATQPRILTVRFR